MLAELVEASREVDLRRDIARQELGGTLQRLAGVGEAAELQPDLAQQMERLAGVGPRLDDAGEHRLRPPAKSPAAARCRASRPRVWICWSERATRRL